MALGCSEQASQLWKGVAFPVGQPQQVVPCSVHPSQFFHTQILRLCGFFILYPSIEALWLSSTLPRAFPGGTLSSTQ